MLVITQPRWCAEFWARANQGITYLHPQELCNEAQQFCTLRKGYFILFSEFFTFILIFLENLLWLLCGFFSLGHKSNINSWQHFSSCSRVFCQEEGMWWVMVCDQNSRAVKIAESWWSSTHRTVLRYLNIFDLWQQKQETLRMNCSSKSINLLVNACALTYYHAIYQSLCTCKSLSALT